MKDLGSYIGSDQAAYGGYWLDCTLGGTTGGVIAGSC